MCSNSVCKYTPNVQFTERVIKSFTKDHLVSKLFMHRKVRKKKSEQLNVES